MAQSIPTYTMSVFKLLSTFIKKLQALTARFWCGGSEESRKIHWLKWDEFIKPNYEGGLGFCDLECFNQALIAKQVWRILKFPNCLMARLLRAKYFFSLTMLNSQIRNGSSYIWQSLCWGKELIIREVRWQVGPGGFSVFKDQWIPCPLTFKPITKPSEEFSSLIVADLISNRQWNEALIKKVFRECDYEFSEYSVGHLSTSVFFDMAL